MVNLHKSFLPLLFGTLSNISFAQADEINLGVIVRPNAPSRIIMEKLVEKFVKEEIPDVKVSFAESPYCDRKDNALAANTLQSRGANVILMAPCTSDGAVDNLEYNVSGVIIDNQTSDDLPLKDNVVRIGPPSSNVVESIQHSLLDALPLPSQEPKRRLEPRQPNCIPGAKSDQADFVISLPPDTEPLVASSSPFEKLDFTKLPDSQKPAICPIVGTRNDEAISEWLQKAGIDLENVGLLAGETIAALEVIKAASQAGTTELARYAKDHSVPTVLGDLKFDPDGNLPISGFFVINPLNKAGFNTVDKFPSSITFANQINPASKDGECKKTSCTTKSVKECTKSNDGKETCTTRQEETCQTKCD